MHQYEEAMRKQAAQERQRKTLLLVALLLGVLGALAGVVTVLTVMFPASTSWTSGLVCSSPYHLVPSTSSYSHRPGQSSTSVTYECVSGADSYEVSGTLVWGLEYLLVAFVLAVIATVALLVWRRARKSG